jgi:ABC-type sugar transport system ATPase subunit
LEDTVIKIHHQQELLKRPAATNNRNFYGKSNMNYSAAAKHNNNDLTTSPTLRDDRLPLGSQPGDSSRDNNNKTAPTFDVDSSNKQQQNIYHQQQQLCAKIHSDDLRLLIRELKRKVDYTEKMNWMCKW